MIVWIFYNLHKELSKVEKRMRRVRRRMSGLRNDESRTESEVTNILDKTDISINREKLDLPESD